MTDEVMSDYVIGYYIIVKIVKLAHYFLKKGESGDDQNTAKFFLGKYFMEWAGRFDYTHPSINSREAFLSKFGQF